jgi:DNA repair photolyase
MELDAWLANNETSEETRAKYNYFMRPEPKDVRSEIMVDEESGLRYRMMAVGMTRNAAEANRKVRKVFLDPIPHLQIENAKPLQGWYKAKIEKAGVRDRPCFTDAMLTEPYGGYCAVGCAFCYINSGVRGYRGSGLVSVPKDYGLQVGRMLDKVKTSAAGYFSSFTDPFLPLEDVYHNTQTGIKAFTDRGLPVFILSRKRYPQWAMDALMLNPHSYAQKSINHHDESTWKRLSPGAATLAEHMEDIRELKDRGIYVSIQVNPIIPGVTSNDDVVKTFEMLKEAGADHVIVKFVEASFSWAPAMKERIEQRFREIKPHAAAKFSELFNCNIGGQRTIDEGYRMEAHPIYMKAATELGLTYSVCYEYKYLRDANGNIINKTGVSVGKDFITSDQCHGQRVPMYSRNTLDEPFREVTECKPTGCLYCGDEAEDGVGAGACGSKLFGAALALRNVHLKNSVWDDVPAPPDPRKPPEPEVDLVSDMFGVSTEAK